MDSSIIIPTLNEQKDIRACLVALQPLRKVCKIILADEGSTDNTVAIAPP